MATTNLGRVVPLDKGEYDANATYELNHIVHYNGSVYWHYGATATTGVAPSDTSVWRVVIDAAAVDAYVGRSETAAGSAEAAQSAAEDSAENAEAWAVGQIGGVNVPSSDPRYDNNAKYYTEQAESANQAVQLAKTAVAADKLSVENTVSGFTANTVPSAVASVESAGGTQVGNVNAAGATQVSAVQQTGAEVLASIPSDYTSLSQTVDYLNSAVEELKVGQEITGWSALHYYIKNNGTTVDFANPNYVSSVNTRYLVTQCSPGDTFEVTATGGSSYRPYSFQDAQDNVIRVAPNGTVCNKEIITAPMGAATLLINDNTQAGKLYKLVSSDSNLFALSNGLAIAIANGTDLDTLTTPGNYYVANSGVAASLLHSPVSNTGFILKVMQTSATNRYFQIAISNATFPEIYLRSNAGAWGDWISVGTKEDSIELTNIFLTASNYLTYFPNGSFNDAPLNSVVGISSNVPLTDGPDGDSWIGYGSHSSTGYIRGTLVTFRPHKTSSTAYSGVTQMLFGFRDNFSPTFSYRTAIIGDSTLVWSPWSKFEENGYVHSGNRVISAGRMSESVSDLDNMPMNAIFQIDKNCNGSTPEATLGHHPFPGYSCIIVDMAFSYSTNHGRAQTVYARDGKVAWRYGYQQDVDDYRWTEWHYYAIDLPAAPTTDGTYTLQCTVSNGAATYAWVSST